MMRNRSETISGVVSDSPEQSRKSVRYEWREPKFHAKWISNILLTGWKKKLFRTTLLLSLVFGVLYIILRPLPFKEVGFDLEKKFLIVFLFGWGGCLYLYLIGPYLIRFSGKRYLVDTKKIANTSLFDTKCYPLKHVIQCDPVTVDDMVEGVIYIQFRTTRSSRPHFLVFHESQWELAQNVYEFLSNEIKQNVINIKPEKPLLKIGRVQHLYLLSLSILGAAGLYFWIMPWFRRIINLDPELLILTILLLGPGTWGLFILYGRKLLQYKAWGFWAMVYNFLTLLLTTLVMMLLVFIELYRIFGDYH